LKSALNLNTDTVGNIYIPFPDNQIQNEISKHLDIKLEILSTSLTLLQNQNQKLQEYRQALITAAVTGKLDVEADVLSDDPEEGSNQMKLF